MFPGTKVAIGPSIEEGFYYDFDRKEPFTVEDLSKIEEKMHELAKKDDVFICKPVKKADAIKLFEEKGEKYKKELAEAIADDTVTFYQFLLIVILGFPIFQFCHFQFLLYILCHVTNSMFFG